MSRIQLVIFGLAGAVLAIGGTALFLIIEDTLRPLPPSYAVGPDSFRQARDLLGDGDTLVAFSLIGAAAGVSVRLAWRWVSHRRKRRRYERGLCVACGYDLRGGTPVCPECGLAAVAHPTR